MNSLIVAITISVIGAALIVLNFPGHAPTQEKLFVQSGFSIEPKFTNDKVDVTKCTIVGETVGGGGKIVAKCEGDKLVEFQKVK